MNLKLVLLSFFTLQCLAYNKLIPRPHPITPPHSLFSRTPTSAAPTAQHTCSTPKCYPTTSIQKQNTGQTPSSLRISVKSTKTVIHYTTVQTTLTISTPLTTNSPTDSKGKATKNPIVYSSSMPGSQSTPIFNSAPQETRANLFFMGIAAVFSSLLYV